MMLDLEHAKLCMISLRIKLGGSVIWVIQQWLSQNLRFCLYSLAKPAIAQA